MTNWSRTSWLAALDRRARLAALAKSAGAATGLSLSSRLMIRSSPEVSAPDDPPPPRPRPTPLAGGRWCRAEGSRDENRVSRSSGGKSEKQKTITKTYPITFTHVLPKSCWNNSENSFQFPSTDMSLDNGHTFWVAITGLF